MGNRPTRRRMLRSTSELGMTSTSTSELDTGKPLCYGPVELQNAGSSDKGQYLTERAVAAVVAATLTVVVAFLGYSLLAAALATALSSAGVMASKSSAWKELGAAKAEDVAGDLEQGSMSVECASKDGTCLSVTPEESSVARVVGHTVEPNEYTVLCKDIWSSLREEELYPERFEIRSKPKAPVEPLFTAPVHDSQQSAATKWLRAHQANVPPPKATPQQAPPQEVELLLMPGISVPGATHTDAPTLGRQEPPSSTKAMLGKPGVSDPASKPPPSFLENIKGRWARQLSAKPPKIDTAQHWGDLPIGARLQDGAKQLVAAIRTGLLYE